MSMLRWSGTAGLRRRARGLAWAAMAVRRAWAVMAVRMATERWLRPTRSTTITERSPAAMAVIDAAVIRMGMTATERLERSSIERQLVRMLSLANDLVKCFCCCNKKESENEFNNGRCGSRVV